MTIRISEEIFVDSQSHSLEPAEESVKEFRPGNYDANVVEQV